MEKIFVIPVEQKDSFLQTIAKFGVDTRLVSHGQFGGVCSVSFKIAKKQVEPLMEEIKIMGYDIVRKG